MVNYLKIKICQETKVVEHTRNLPFAKSQLFTTKVKDYTLLTNGEDVKRTYDVCLDLQGIQFDFKPGDAIGVVPENDEMEVAQILQRLELPNYDCYYELSVLKDTSKRNTMTPPHIPTCGLLKDLFLKYLDIRSVPKKLFLKTLIQYSDSESDRETLVNLCDPKHSNLYEKFITENGRTLLRVLTHFRSCHPPLERILEHLPPLLPRYYSIASSPLQVDELHFAFSVIETPDFTGVCSGWLEKKLKIPDAKIPFYFRRSSDFLMLPEENVPIVMIGPGTGVAPFVGYLKHLQLEAHEPVYRTLYFGCRYSNRDYIYKDDILRLLDAGVLSELETTFSRETEKKMYVQDRILKNGAKIVGLILDKGAVVCVCGDGKNMARDVENAIISCLIQHGKMNQEEAVELLEDMKKTNKFQLDIWI